MRLKTRVISTILPRDQLSSTFWWFSKIRNLDLLHEVMKTYIIKHVWVQSKVHVVKYDRQASECEQSLYSLESEPFNISGLSPLHS